MSRTFADADDDNIDFGTTVPSMYAVSDGCIAAIMRNDGASSGPQRNYFRQSSAFNELVSLSMVADGTGLYNVFWRTPSALQIFKSTNRFDDDLWHRVVVIRKSSTPELEIFVDGVSEGTDGDPGTDASTPTITFIGRDEAAGSSFGGDIFRFATWTGVALTIEEVDGFLLTGKWRVRPDLWYDLGNGSPELDLSGNGHSGTVNGPTVSDNGPATLRTPKWAANFVDVIPTPFDTFTKRLCMMNFGE